MSGRARVFLSAGDRRVVSPAPPFEPGCSFSASCPLALLNARDRAADGGGAACFGDFPAARQKLSASALDRFRRCEYLTPLFCKIPEDVWRASSVRLRVRGILGPLVRVGRGEMWGDAGRLAGCHAKNLLDREAFRYKLVRNRTEFCESRKENRVETDRKNPHRPAGIAAGFLHGGSASRAAASGRNPERASRPPF